MIQPEELAQGESHRVYTLQDAYQRRTPTTSLKNAMALQLFLKSLKNSCFGREVQPTFDNL